MNTPVRIRISAFVSFLAAGLLIPALCAADPLMNYSDFDGDGRGDLFAYDANKGVVVVRKSNDSTFQQIQLDAGSVPSLVDPDGDGTTDLATFNPTNAAWVVYLNGERSESFSFGNPGDRPVPGNYHQKLRTNYASYDRKDAKWRIRSLDGDNVTQIRWGKSGDVAVPADFDCDGLTDLATFRRSSNLWTIRRSKNNQKREFAFGLWGDIPMPGDYDGNGCAEAAVYRPSSNQFFVRNSANGESFAPISWGLPGDMPSRANVDGRGGLDLVVFRPAEGNFYVSTRPDTSFVLAGFGLPNFGSASSATPELPSRPVRPISSVWNQSVSSRVLGSYTGGMLSDFVLVRSQSFGRNRWVIRHGDGTSSSFDFGDAKSVPVAGDFTGDARMDPVVVQETDSGLLEWRLRTENGFERSARFGLNGDTALTGDFDCDGKNDFAVTRKIAGLHNWFLLLSSGEQKGPIAFGLENDRVFAADVNGNGCDELVVAQDVAGLIYWFYVDAMKIAEGPENPGIVQWGLAADDALTPMDFNGDGKSDFVVVREIAGGKYFFLRFSGIDYGLMVPFGLAGDVPMSGYYSGANIAELAVYRPGAGGAASAFYVRHTNGAVLQIPLGSGLDTVVRPDGRKPAKSAASPCDVTRDFFDGQGGSLWKPVSDNTGNPVFLLPSEYWTSIEDIKIYGADGQFITEGRPRNCCPNGGRAHYDSPKSGSFLQQFAPIELRFQLRNGATECRVVNNPSRRED